MSFEKDFEGDVVKVSAFGRAVVAKRVAIVAAVTILVQLAVSYGWFSIDISNNVLHYLNAILDGVGAIVAVGVIHPVVTPSKDPRNDSGTALVPASQVEALIANAVEEAKGGDLTDAVGEVTTAVDDAVADVQEVKDTVSEAETPAETADVAVSTVDDSDDETVEETDPTVVLPQA